MWSTRSGGRLKGPTLLCRARSILIETHRDISRKRTGTCIGNRLMLLRHQCPVIDGDGKVIRIKCLLFHMMLSLFPLFDVNAGFDHWFDRAVWRYR